MSQKYIGISTPSAREQEGNRGGVGGVKERRGVDDGLRWQLIGS